MENADIKLDQQFLYDFRTSTIQRLGRDVNVEAGSGEVFIGTGSLGSPNIVDIKICLSIAKPCDTTITGMQKSFKNKH